MDATTLGAAMALMKKAGSGGGSTPSPAPAGYELINEETYTNAELAHHPITTDKNGNEFELTDVILLFETPKQDTSSQKASDGQIQFYYGPTGDDYYYWNIGTWTQNADAAAHGAFCFIEQRDGLVFISATQNATAPNYGNFRYVYRKGFGIASGIFPVGDGFSINKIDIRGVLGTAHYVLYGKRA